MRPITCILLALSAGTASSALAELPPLPSDRLPWYTCDTIPLDDPDGYTVRISRDYLRLALGYAEVWTHARGLEPQQLVGTWQVVEHDASNGDRLDKRFQTQGFEFRYVLWLDLDRPPPDGVEEAAAFRADIGGGRTAASDNMVCTAL